MQETSLPKRITTNHNNVIVCERCGRSGKLYRHHLSYVPEEIMVLCGRCHRQVHKEEETPRDPRHPVTFRIDNTLWQEFKHTCHSQGMTTCQVLKGMIYAIVKGTEATEPTINTRLSFTINMTMQHIVERPRRRGQITECTPDPYLCAEKCATAFKKRFEGGENR